MVIEDRVFGQIKIEEPVIEELINSYPIQRLKQIDQAGYFQPFVSIDKHDRFYHSVGVYYLLKKYQAPLEEQVAGLIHDVSHAAFSHCADYIFAQGSEAEQDFQDKIFNQFVKDTEIPQILKKHNFDLDYILNEHNFPILENNVPDICADRIDYSLRTAVFSNQLAQQDIKYFLEKLSIKNNQWYFIDFESGKRFAENFKKMNQMFYSGIESGLMFTAMKGLMSYALKQGYIDQQDFFKTDKVVLDKIRNKLTVDPELLKLYRRLNNLSKYENNPNDYDFTVKVKSRIIDPYILEKDNLVRLSDLDTSWKETVEQGLKPKEYFIKYL